MQVFTEIKEAIDSQIAAFELFRKANTEKVSLLESTNQTLLERIEILESKRLGPGRIGNAPKSEEMVGFERYIKTGDLSGCKEAKEMSIVGGAASGGAMVPEVIADQIISRAISRSLLLTLVRDTPVKTADYVRLVNLRGATASWVGENGTRSATATPQLREVRPTSGELYSYPAVTNFLLNDSQFNVESFLSENVSDTFSKSLEAALISGTGVDQPTGILNTSPVSTADTASPVRNADAIQYINGTGDLADDIVDLYFSLKGEYRRNAKFLMNSVTLAAVRKLRDANGSGFLWQSGLGAAMDQSDGVLVGKPVITSEMLGVSGASPLNYSIMCGDFLAGYELIRIGQLAVIRDPITTPGKTKFYISMRLGGRLTDNDAIKVLRA